MRTATTRLQSCAFGRAWVPHVSACVTASQRSAVTGYGINSPHPVHREQQSSDGWRTQALLIGRIGPGNSLRTAGRCLATAGSQGSGVVFTLPTILTIARVAAIPVLIAVWFQQAAWATPAATAIFLAASITDWLDGYLARKMNASSAFGAFLDPVADKLMVAAVLILMCTQPLAAGPLAGDTILLPVCTLAIIGREITMSALREWAATMGGEARSAVAVSSLGKWKTATQMASLTLLLMLRDGPLPGTLGEVAAVAGPALLVVATALTLISLFDYMRALWRFMG